MDPHWLTGLPIRAGLKRPAATSRPSTKPLFTRTSMQISLARDRRRGPRAAWLEHLCIDCLEQGPRALDKAELSALASDSTSLAWLHHQVWQAPADSPWSRILDIRMQAHRRQGQGLPAAITTD